jgi:hypothetical protein
MSTRHGFSNAGRRDCRVYDQYVKSSWDEVAAWNPKSWILPKDGFCEDCKKIVEVKLDDPPKQTCMTCGSEKVRKATKQELTAQKEGV